MHAAASDYSAVHCLEKLWGKSRTAGNTLSAAIDLPST